MKRLRLPRPALIAVLAIALSVPSTAPVAAHAADGGGNCSGNIKVVVFEHRDLGGVSDDLCMWWTWSTGGPRAFYDPHFSQNNVSNDWIPSDDIGDRYLMSGYVSSYSILNSSPKRMCIRLYPDPDFGGIGITHKLESGSHIHINPAPAYNDTFDSLYMVVNVTDWSEC